MYTNERRSREWVTIELTRRICLLGTCDALGKGKGLRDSWLGGCERQKVCGHEPIATRSTQHFRRQIPGILPTRTWTSSSLGSVPWRLDSPSLQAHGMLWGASTGSGQATAQKNISFWPWSRMTRPRHPENRNCRALKPGVAEDRRKVQAGVTLSYDIPPLKCRNCSLRTTLAITTKVRHVPRQVRMYMLRCCRR